MLPWLQNYIQQETHCVIGLMSGTSLDGIDAALCEVAGSGDTLRAQLRGFLSVPFAPDVRERIQSACQNGGVEDAARLNVELGELFAAAALQLMAQHDLSRADVHLIGSHGQTICHLPDERATLQIGEPAIIVERSGITTVADFRPRDMACGGQGAPLVPYADWCLLRRADTHRVVQNIGGIGNCTLLPAGCALDEVRAWDTGPGNMVMDECARGLTNGERAFDQDGEMAARGPVDEAWLAQLMEHPFFARRPPKSTGREDFGCTYTSMFVEEGRRRGLSAEGIVATATALTAQSIAHSLRAFGASIFDAARARNIELIVGGGGAFNPMLRRMLQERLANGFTAGDNTHQIPITVLTHEDCGLRSDAKEALAFAMLAHETIMGAANNVPGATGASRRVVLGKIIPGG